MSRTKKRDYTRSKEYTRSCRSHGSCRWCKGNRTHHNDVAEEKADKLYEEYLDEDSTGGDEE